MASAWDAALRYLGQRDHASAELRVKLGRRFPPEEVEAVMVRLADAGLLDDNQFAVRYASSLVQKGDSRRAISRKLAAKGIGQDGIDHALQQVESGDELDRAVELAQKRLGALREVPAEKRRRRTLSFLARRGYSEGICYAAVARAEGSNDER